MAQTPEARVKSAVRAILKEAGVYHFSTATFGMGRSGVPDIIACVNGYFLSIECKAGKGKPTPLQLAEMAGIAGSGGRALVINESNLDLLRITLKMMQLSPETGDDT